MIVPVDMFTRYVHARTNTCPWHGGVATMGRGMAACWRQIVQASNAATSSNSTAQGRDGGAWAGQHPAPKQPPYTTMASQSVRTWCASTLPHPRLSPWSRHRTCPPSGQAGRQAYRKLCLPACLLTGRRQSSARHLCNQDAQHSLVAGKKTDRSGAACDPLAAARRIEVQLNVWYSNRR